MNKSARLLLLFLLFSGGMILAFGVFESLSSIEIFGLILGFSFSVFVMLIYYTLAKRRMKKRFDKEFEKQRKLLNQRQITISSFLFWNSGSGGSSEPEPQHGDVPENMWKE